eukprot:TRINITY_DN1757_c0_g1_i1.p1 TRINITY_DN1757_c0_g1~~TRINITY_DN1757_c0_g1_i1.p1  ORF type:complete len:294 (+),score=76.25 TRINITY_DN1757_c0_g1_i1:83-964(+)
MGELKLMSFEKVEKREREVLDKNYFDGTFLKVGYKKKATKNLKYSFDFNQELRTLPSFETETRGNFGITFKKGDFKFSEVVGTGKSLDLDLSFKLNRWIKGTKIFVNSETDEPANKRWGKLGIENKGKYHRILTQLTADDKAYIENHWELFGKKKDNHFGAGVVWTFGQSKFFYNINQAFLHFRNKQFAFYLQTHFDQLNLFLAHRVKGAQVGLRLKHSFSDKTDEVECGGYFKPNDKLAVRFKIDHNFNITSAFTLDVNEWLTASLSSRYEVTPPRDGPVHFPIGFKLKLKD